MASTSKAFKKWWIRVLVIWHPRTHRLLRLLFGRRARTRCLWGGNLRALWAVLYEKAPFLVCPSFRGKRVKPSASRDSGTTATEARRRMKSWGSQADLADELERELSLSHESAGNEGEPLDYGDAISLTSSDPAASALLGYAQKEQEMSEGEEAETELSQTSYHRLPLSNSPATTISATWPRLGGDLDRSQTGPMMTFGTGSSKLPYWWSGPEVSSEVSWNLLGLQVILVCKSLGNPIGPFSGPLHATVWSSQHCSPRLRGSPMSMPLPSERLSFLSSEEWVLRSPEPLLVELALLPSPRWSFMSMPLPSERLSSLSFLRKELSALPRALW